MMRTITLLVATLVLASPGCKSKADTDNNANSDMSAASDRIAAIDCLRAVRADARVDLTLDYTVQLCSGARDAKAPIECYVAALEATELDLNSEGALMLCSRFNLDAFNAKSKSSPIAQSCDLSGVEMRLATIESKLTN
jgi:hypothetical protein